MLDVNSWLGGKYMVMGPKGVDSTSTMLFSSVDSILFFLFFGGPLHSINNNVIMLHANINKDYNALPLSQHSYNILRVTILACIPTVPISLANRALMLPFPVGCATTALSTSFEPVVPSSTGCGS